MTFPGSLETIEVTGTSLETIDGEPLNGSIIFEASTPLYIAGEVVLEGSAVMTVTNGAADAPLTLPCTDAVSPGFTYTIYQRLDTPDGVNPAPVTGVVIPHTMQPAVDVSALL